MPIPHKHAALIKQWADDPSLTVWYWDAANQNWFDCEDDPDWSYDHMAVGALPTQPPRKMCSLAGVEFPAPETVAPLIGSKFYVANMTRRDWSKEYAYNWRGDSDGAQLLLEVGLVHLTYEAAEQHSKALLAANKQAIEGAK